VKISRGRVRATAVVVYEHQDHAAVRGNVTSRAWFWPCEITVLFTQGAEGYLLDHVRVHGPNAQSWAKGDRKHPPMVEARWTEKAQAHPQFHLSHAPVWVQEFVKEHRPGGTTK